MDVDSDSDGVDASTFVAALDLVVRQHDPLHAVTGATGTVPGHGPSLDMDAGAYPVLAPAPNAAFDFMDMHGDSADAALQHRQGHSRQLQHAHQAQLQHFAEHLGAQTQSQRRTTHTQQDTHQNQQHDLSVTSIFSGAGPSKVTGSDSLRRTSTAAESGRSLDGSTLNVGILASAASPSSTPQPHACNSQSQSASFDALQHLLSMQFPMNMPGLPGVSSMPGSVTTDGTPTLSSSMGFLPITQMHQSQTSNASQNTSAAVLLEQQLRLTQLQQLQQLQNHIFQQQMELISGQGNLSGGLDMSAVASTVFKDQNQFHGLPTPVNSAEIRAQPNPAFVPPMFAQSYGVPPSDTPMTAFTSPHPVPHSAPAHLAFNTHTTSDLEFEVSPLTSPWLGAYQQNEQPQVPESRARRGSKRGASGSGDDAYVQARKRQPPAIRNAGSSEDSMAVAASSVIPSSNLTRRSSTRGSASLNSTPALRARFRKNSVAGEAVGDTPSPVELSMPPPAPPSQCIPVTGESNQSLQQQQQQQQQESPISSTASLCSSQNSSLSPVTPASIMNLGRLGLPSGLASNDKVRETPQLRGKSKSKSPPDASVASGSSPARIAIRKGGSIASPSLKPLLPGGLPPSSAAQLASASNYSHHLSGSAAALNIAPGAALPPSTPAVRKTSHKAAEQKRRDSLKSSFDSLRLLLPPIPLPSDEGYDGEPPLPGAMPPRGPPRGDASGPNRAVSKLQLLRCGNDYIARLKARIARRDEYIEQLRTEVRLLRENLKDMQSDDLDAMSVELGNVDLEKDLDAEEANAPRLGSGHIHIENEVHETHELDDVDEEACD